MKRRLLIVIAVVFLLFVLTRPVLNAQVAPICDNGGVCGTDPNPGPNPSYGGLLAARPLIQNALEMQNPAVAISSPSGSVPIIIGSQSYNKAFPIVLLPGRDLEPQVVANGCRVSGLHKLFVIEMETAK